MNIFTRHVVNVLILVKHPEVSPASATADP